VSVLSAPSLLAPLELSIWQGERKSYSSCVPLSAATPARDEDSTFAASLSLATFWHFRAKSRKEEDGEKVPLFFESERMNVDGGVRGKKEVGETTQLS